MWGCRFVGNPHTPGLLQLNQHSKKFPANYRHNSNTTMAMLLLTRSTRLLHHLAGLRHPAGETPRPLHPSFGLLPIDFMDTFEVGDLPLGLLDVGLQQPLHLGVGGHREHLPHPFQEAMLCVVDVADLVRTTRPSCGSPP